MITAYDLDVETIATEIIVAKRTLAVAEKEL